MFTVNVFFSGKGCMRILELEPAMDIPYGNNVKIELDSLVEGASEALSVKKAARTP